MRSIVYSTVQPCAEPGFSWLPIWRTTLSGRGVHGWVHARLGKAPKLKAQPGSMVAYKGQLYEVMYCYRTEENPSEWIYYLEERSSMIAATSPVVQQLVQELGAGEGVRRVVSALFRNSTDAAAYFSDIYRAADAVVVTNGNLVRYGKVLSSGPIEETTP